MSEPEMHVAVASSSGRRAALGDSHTVVVFDPGIGVLSKRFETTFDGMPQRLALSDEFDALLTASYWVHGLASYCAENGRERWRRKDLVRVERISLARDGLTAYCGRHKGSLAVVDVGSGESIRTIRGAYSVHESMFDPVHFVDSARPRLLDDVGGRSIGVSRTTFAFLDVGFGPGRAFVTESAGPVRCLDIADGLERWRYVPEPGCHVLSLGYQTAESLLLGVEWAYESGGPKRLIRWSEDDGSVIDTTLLGNPIDCCIGLAGEVVVSTDGRIISTSRTRS